MHSVEVRFRAAIKAPTVVSDNIGFNGVVMEEGLTVGRQHQPFEFVSVVGKVGNVLMFEDYVKYVLSIVGCKRGFNEVVQIHLNVVDKGGILQQRLVLSQK
jgi:hypothetical protein